MDEYSYINIFDTKGIEYLVIIAFLVLLIPFWRALNKPIKARAIAMSTLQALTANILKIKQGIFYNPNHTWARPEYGGYANVGLDDLLLHIVGPVNIKTLKMSGDRVVKGEQFAQIESAERVLKIKSPLTGKIERVNTLLDKETLSNDPYGKGWMYKIKTEKWAEETNSSIQDNEVAIWFKNELLRLKDFLATSLNKNALEPAAVILQEGGELADNPLSEMSAEIWYDFQENFLNN
ncbi:MAG: hypothetical protein C0595_05315 [Marinilabiliales bacterium]|nr:MAG: hypothetical protein C0595_05315 [Marinilabiliales bacterium]